MRSFSFFRKDNIHQTGATDRCFFYLGDPVDAETLPVPAWGAAVLVLDAVSMLDFGHVEAT